MKTSIKTKVVPIEAIENAFSVETPTIVLQDDAPSQVLLTAFGEMIAIYRSALWEISQGDSRSRQVARSAVQRASLVEKKAITESLKLINAEKARKAKKG